MCPRNVLRHARNDPALSAGGGNRPERFPSPDRNGQPSRNLPGGSPRDVAMEDPSGPAEPLELGAKLLTDRDRAVLAAGAADRDREVAPVFTAVLRQQVGEEIGQPRQDLRIVLLALEEIDDLRLLAGLLPETRNEVGVRQEADVEQEVGAVRDSPLEAEAHQRDDHPRLAARVRGELAEDLAADLVDRPFAR